VLSVGQEPEFPPYTQGAGKVPRDLNRMEWVFPQGEPSGPEPPLQRSHI